MKKHFLRRKRLEEEIEEYEKTEDLVQAYFYSMGDISILTKDEETELAKRLEEGENDHTRTHYCLATYTRNSKPV